MKPARRSHRFFVIEAGSSALIGIEPKTTISIRLGEGVKYSAPIEKIHAAMRRWNAKQNPTGSKRRRFFTSSDQLKNLKA
jgi:hypothetical protein